jgi:hypothetical protein
MSVRVSFGTGGPMHEAVSFAASHDYLADPESAVDVGVVLVAEDLPRRTIPVLFARDARVGEDAIVAGWGLDAHRARRQTQ